MRVVLRAEAQAVVQRGEVGAGDGGVAVFRVFIEAGAQTAFVKLRLQLHIGEFRAALAVIDGGQAPVRGRERHFAAQEVGKRAGELRAVRRDVRGREQFAVAEAKHPRKGHEQLAQGDGDLPAIAQGLKGVGKRP